MKNKNMKNKIIKSSILEYENKIYIERDLFVTELLKNFDIDIDCINIKDLVVFLSNFSLDKDKK